MLKVGIVAVHGVIPQVRYGFQDQVASTLCDNLNDPDPKVPRVWKQTVVLPRNGTANTSDIPTISRVHKIAEPNPDNPTMDFFDVHEAFWSPIDKNKTNFASVISWLLKTVFLPFNDFARFMESFWKVAWDVVYIGIAIALGIGAFVLSALMAASALRDTLARACTNGTPPPLALKDFTCGSVSADSLSASFWNILHLETWREIVKPNAFDNLFTLAAYLLSPLTLVKILTPPVIIGVVFGVGGSFLAMQALRSLFFLACNLGGLKSRDPIQFISRFVAIALVAGIAGVCLYKAWNTGTTPGTKIGGSVLYLVLATFAFESGRGLLTWFVVNFFGDVQIYTTRNQNSEYFSLREQILKKVTDTIVNVVANAPAGGPYDRVYIMAHSLGSTIAMDALMRLYDVQKASATLATPVIGSGDWNRIRGFVTFGTALEKTKYFFNVWNATPPQEWEQWGAASYGGLFTADQAALTASTADAGIFWLNNWYFSDFVSDKITTYRSFLVPGEGISDYSTAVDQVKKNAKKGEAYIGRLLAFNRTRFGPFPRYLQTHTHYLEKAWFWHAQGKGDIGALDMLVSTSTHVALTRPLRSVMMLSLAPPSLPARAEPIPQGKAFTRRSWEVVK